MCYPLRQVAVDRPTAFSTDAAVFLHQSAELYVAVDEEREISLKTQKKTSAICHAENGTIILQYLRYKTDTKRSQGFCYHSLDKFAEGLSF